ncbi:MAG: enolase C-terminal domain-like protein, partial [Dehalococcoidia bacterium]|nr:enolase C-terminal domain-like protein [Dehalococcoidia bacterium]
MKIDSIEISVFELPMYPATTQVIEIGTPSALRYRQAFPAGAPVPVQVMRVVTDEGVDGVCTVGDWRYTELSWRQIAQLRELAIGEDPLDRDRLGAMLTTASRFFEPGWFGGFDNCLWDIAGKVAGVPVARLLGDAKPRVQAYYNTSGGSIDELLRDGESGLSAGYTVLKDHLAFSTDENIRDFREFRSAFGNDVGLMHDAALAGYTFSEALEVGRALEAQDFIWFEEPVPDRQHRNYVMLCEELDIPIAGAETLMNEPELGELWLETGAIDILRVNARHGTTPLLRSAEFAAGRNANVEPNTYGPLFGIIHAHVGCGIGNIDWFEVAPPANGAEMGEEIGLMNPIRPVDGWVTYPDAPGWGA